MSTEPAAPDFWALLQRPIRELSDDDLTTVAADIALALAASMSTDKIQPKHWWDRLQSSLVAASERSPSWPEWVSTAARKLQIDVLSPRSSSLSTWGERLRDRPDFTRFARFVARNAVYVIAVARGERERRKTPVQEETP